MVTQEIRRVADARKEPRTYSYNNATARVSLAACCRLADQAACGRVR